MVHPLTIVLPLHNAERQVATTVREIFEAAQSVSSSVSLVIVDDGSDDETYEEACQLSRYYPRMTVLRQPVRHGLGAALDLVRDRVAVDRVLMHDGVSPICASQLVPLLRPQQTQTSDMATERAVPSASELLCSRRVAAEAPSQESNHRAHTPLSGFHWLTLEAPTTTGRRTIAARHAASDTPPPRTIPTLTNANITGMAPIATTGR